MHGQHEGSAVERTLPRPWEERDEFHDALYDWMERAPWLAMSAVAHVMLFLLVALIPWNMVRRVEPTVVESAILERPVEPWVDPEPELLPPLEDEPTLDEPALQDAELSDEVQADDAAPTEDPPSDSRLDDFAPFDDTASNADLGVGGCASGRYGGRFGGGQRRGGGGGTERSVIAGLEWLAHHQEPDGRWDADGFARHDPPGDRCDGAGQPEHDVGVTGLALLAFLGDGHTTRAGLHRDRVARGVLWLRDQADPDSGFVGERVGHSYMYDHGIATLALCETYYFSRSPVLRRPAQAAISFVSRARNPYGAWRYDAPPTGDNDTSVTGWMVLALKSAEDSGLVVDSAALPDALAWIDEVTDRGTGRVGYDSVGSPSSRVPGANEHFPTDETECMTAVGLLCRFFLGQDPRDQPLMRRHADLLLRALPEHDPDGLTNDLYYWYYGSYAMYQMGEGGAGYWKKWNRAMKGAVLDSQRSDGAARGSWDPDGPWGHAGGRVYSTALGVLCLEVYYRYARIVSAR